MYQASQENNSDDATLIPRVSNKNNSNKQQVDRRRPKLKIFEDATSENKSQTTTIMHSTSLHVDARVAKSRFRSRQRCFIYFATCTLLAIIIIELVLTNPNLSRSVEASKKKKMMKKIKEILPLIALLKRKKIVLLPIPM